MRFWTTIGLILVLSAVGLTYEIAAGRVLAPFFGTSLLTWTAVIAAVLAGFSVGNALGGLVAERPRAAAIRTVRAALIGTAVLAALTPALLGLLYAGGARGTAGMIMSVAVAFGPASVLVSLPSPLLARIAVEARPGREGSSLGLVLAAGSLGAIAGAILAGFVALPLIGSAATFAACGATALLCLPFLGREDRSPRNRGSTVIALAAALVVAGGFAGGRVCEYESGLSCIDVTQQGGALHLYSDRVWQAAERTGPDAAARDLVLPYARWIWSRMDRDLGPAPSVLFVGGGGYTLPTKLLATHPDARATVVEIDPLVTEVVSARMPWAGAMIAAEGRDGAAPADAGGRLGIVHADGRVFLNETEHLFDAAVMDAFSSGSVPAHLATRETYERLRRIVAGPIYVNLIDRPGGDLARGVHTILSELYPHVEAVQGPVSPRGRANLVLAASPDPIAPLAAMPEGYRAVSLPSGRAFTDDRGWVGHR